MNAEELAKRLTAIASVQRLRILANLATETVHVSELARRLGMSRALLYMHLSKLEEAGYLAGRLELSEDGKALKIFDIVPFSVTVDQEVIIAAVTETNESEK